MGSIYQWVGGHTGWTGANSGWTLTGGGTSGTQQVWTSVVYGTQSLSGDYLFGPYFWGNIRNWRIATAATGQAGAYSYAIPTVFPKATDTVIFSGGFTAANGLTTNTFSVSCLYGGMSGDGFTASGSTGWYGATGATSSYTSAAHGDIAFNVTQTFKKTYHPLGFDTGQIGAGATSSGVFDSFAPLKIRTTNFNFADSDAPNGSGTRVAVENISSTATYPYFYFYAPFGTVLPRYGIANLKGKWEQITHWSGSCFATDITCQGDGYWNSQGNLQKFGSSSTNAMRYYNITPTSLINGGYIWGAYQSQAIITIGGFSGNSQVTIGSFNDGQNPTVTTLWLVTGTAGTQQTGPNVKLATVFIDELKMDAGTLSVSELVTRYDYPIIRDGYAKGTSTINMYHPTDPTWQNFLLAYAGGDNGLRIDSPDVTIRCYKGQSLKTGTPEGGTGGF